MKCVVLKNNQRLIVLNLLHQDDSIDKLDMRCDTHIDIHFKTPQCQTSQKHL